MTPCVKKCVTYDALLRDTRRVSFCLFMASRIRMFSNVRTRILHIGDQQRVLFIRARDEEASLDARK